MEKSEFQGILREGSEAVARLVSGAIDLHEFLQVYDNFYYTLGLNGDCSDEQRTLISQFPEAISFHRSVQDALNLCYLDVNVDADAYHAAGRLSPVETEQRIREVAIRCRLNDLLKYLSEPC